VIAHKQIVQKRDGIQFHLAFLQPATKQTHFSPVTQLDFRAFACATVFLSLKKVSVVEWRTSFSFKTTAKPRRFT
jgi:hypothetical protein